MTRSYLKNNIQVVRGIKKLVEFPLILCVCVCFGVFFLEFPELFQTGVSEWWFNAVSATKAIFTARTC